MNQADLEKCEENRKEIYKDVNSIKYWILAMTLSIIAACCTGFLKLNDGMAVLAESSHKTQGKVDLLIELKAYQAIPSVNSDNPIANSTKPNGKERL